MDEYLKNVAQKFARTDAANGREMIYRADFEILLKSIFDVDGVVKQINHDSTNDNGNKPDFVIAKNNVPILYIEAKDIGVDLDKIEKSNQMDRYFGYDNLVLTDYLEFRFYRNGEKYGEPVIIAKYDKENRSIIEVSENFSLLKQTLLDFASTHKEPIKRGKHLAKIMGGKAQRIRDNVREMLVGNNEKYEELNKIQAVVKKNLIANLDDEDFADMYAQTLVYGLFAARYNDTTQETFSRIEARELISRTNPFLRSFFDHIAGQSFPDRLRFIVDELCEVFTHANVDKLLHDFYGKDNDKDPVIHFYEDFLREYDPKKKMEMGVFYTPTQVVKFIVKSVDEVLKNEFNLKQGLADTTKIQIVKYQENAKGKSVKVPMEVHKVQILDIATGTGTFLDEIVQHVYKGFSGQEGRWPAYVDTELLPRLHGFELMIASYTIAHMKLGMRLHETGVITPNKRIGVYLTNTLDEPQDYSNQGSLFGVMDAIAEESKDASRIKQEYPIMCVIGNPPYSGVSQNKRYSANNDYKVEIGGKEKLKEKKNWLDDDYVKFIRFAESMVEKNGEGIVAMITAHGYLTNPTFRGMRWHLRNTFDKIYVLDLHGNSNKDETDLDGGKDENVFDIKTGVAIIVGIKKAKIKNKKLATIYKGDLYGSKSNKSELLNSITIESYPWVELSGETDVWYQEGKGKAEYSKGFSVDEIFIKSSTGIVSMADNYIITKDKSTLSDRIENLLNNDVSESVLKNEYILGKNYAKWVLENKSQIDYDPLKLIPISYRPFDIRYTYYDSKLIWRPRAEVMKNFLNHENIALVTNRQVKAGKSWQHIFVSEFITESGLTSNKTSEIGKVFPLYLFENGDKLSNIKKDFSGKISEIVGEITPEQIIDYIYAYLHSSIYREKYTEFLKIDFPRIPYPASRDQFLELVSFGEQLKELHLMRSSSLNAFTTTFPEIGSDIVEKILFKDFKVYINDQQYFGNIPAEAWEFVIGSYQPAQKWLKDRKGDKLSANEINHYQKVVTSLFETHRIMGEINKIISL